MNKCFFIKIKSLLFIVGLVFIFLCSSCGSGQRSLFKSQSKKGPNIYSSKPPRSNSRSKLYGHSVSRKKIKGKKGSVFSKKKRYKSTVNSKSSKGDKGAKSSSGGRKSGKGKKKDK